MNFTIVGILAGSLGDSWFTGGSGTAAAVAQSMIDHWVCVDWGKDSGKRAVYHADVQARAVSRWESNRWNIDELYNRSLELDGSVCIAIDAAIGIPESYASHFTSDDQTPIGFIDWLNQYFDANIDQVPCRDPASWSPTRPFIHVPKGQGGLRSMLDVAGSNLRRSVEQHTLAKSPFIVSGIPGTVGSGSRALWNEIVASSHDLPIWPFHGSLNELAATRQPFLAEIYPRVCYAMALADDLPAPLLSVAKTNPKARSAATATLRNAQWPITAGVSFSDTEIAESNEDDFDAFISAAALLRASVETRQLEEDEISGTEGSMLGLPQIKKGRAKSLVTEPLAEKPASKNATSRTRPRESTSGTNSYECPIDGCKKVFKNSRGGWDAHVASYQMHPDWNPDVKDPSERKAIFRREFADWFSPPNKDFTMPEKTQHAWNIEPDQLGAFVDFFAARTVALGEYSDRVWNRFNWLLTIQVALAGFGVTQFETLARHPFAKTVVIGIGLIISVLWLFMGWQDKRSLRRLSQRTRRCEFALSQHFSKDQLVEPELDDTTDPDRQNGFSQSNLLYWFPLLTAILWIAGGILL